jgi:glycosyltransferase involved in cell wall biosynthesis
MQDQFTDLLKLTPYAYKLDNFLPQAAWEQFVTGVLSALDHPILFNVGSNWLYEHLAVLKSSFPNMKVIDQQFNEVGHLASNSRQAKAIDLTVAAYQALTDRLRLDGRSPESVRTIHIGVDKPLEVATADTVEFRSSLGIPAHAKLVLWVGRLSVEKRPDWIVRLAEEVGGPSLRVVMVGNGPLVNELGRRMDRCKWLTWVSHLESLGPAYAAADLFVLSSAVEGVPLTLMETLERGTPAVVTAVGGVSDLEDTEGVYMTPGDDYFAFKAEVVRRLHDGTHGVHLPDRYRMDNMLQLYDRLIDSI